MLQSSGVLMDFRAFLFDGTRMKTKSKNRDVEALVRNGDNSQSDVEALALNGNDSIWDRGEQPSGQTDIANSKRFVKRYRERICFVPEHNSFYVFDGVRWVEDSTLCLATELAIKTAEDIWKVFTAKAREVEGEAKDRMYRWAKHAASAGGLSAMVKLSRTDSSIRASFGDFDRDVHLINCLNGTVDIATGRMHKHRSADKLTQLANVAYDPDAKCNEWLATLSLVFDGNQELIRYVRALFGLALSGTRKETIVPICFGSGANGKSTIWNTIAKIFGSYATLAHAELLTPTRNQAHPTEKAQLAGKRFVALSEIEQGLYLREDKLKELSGENLINCRRCEEDFWTFEPKFMFWLSTNHLPKVRGTDEAVWRRLKPIPFTVNLQHKARELNLPQRKNHTEWLFENEASGIFSWVVQGYQDYCANGLIEPKAVTDATIQYRTQEDELSRFVNETCEFDLNNTVTASELFKAYQAWGGTIETQTKFGSEFKNRDDKRIAKYTSGGIVKYRGIALIDQ